MAAPKQLPRFVEFGKKIIGIGRNFSEHAAELGNAVPTEPVVFLKPTTAYVTWPNPIKMPVGSSEIHHEVELGLVIGTAGRNIPESVALSHVGGYILALDMTERNLQTKLKSAGLPWALAKGFDTSCPVSDFIVKDKIPDPQAVDLWLKVNGAMRQESNTRNMIFSIAFLVHWTSRHFTLERGDVILTGTPPGVGAVKPGDVIECGLGSIAKMSFAVVEGD